jgi:hypothetical protein
VDEAQVGVGILPQEIPDLCPVVIAESDICHAAILPLTPQTSTEPTIKPLSSLCLIPLGRYFSIFMNNQPMRTKLVVAFSDDSL